MRTGRVLFTAAILLTSSATANPINIDDGPAQNHAQIAIDADFGGFFNTGMTPAPAAESTQHHQIMQALGVPLGIVDPGSKTVCQFACDTPEPNPAVTLLLGLFAAYLTTRFLRRIRA